MRLSPLAEPPPPLLLELRWFIQLRWLAGLTVVVGALVAAAWFGPGPRVLGAIIVGAVVLLSNIPFWTSMRRSPEARPWMSQAAIAAILLDLAAMALLTLWTGGLRSPLPGLFVLHVILASLLLRASLAYLAAAAAVVLLLGGLLVTGDLPTDRPQILIALGWALALLLTAYVANHVTAELREHHGQLRRQARRMRAILDTAADGIITMSARGIIESVNPAAERIFGYSAAEMVGRNVSMLMTEPDRGAHDGYLAEYLRTGKASIIGVGREVTGRRRDGSELPLDLSVSEVRLESTVLFTGILRDISERKAAEHELRRLNESLQRQQRAMVQQEKMAAMGQMAAGVAHEVANPLASMDSLLQLVDRRPERFTPQTIKLLRDQVERISGIVRRMTDFAHPGETAPRPAALNPVVQDALAMMRFDHRIRGVEVVREFDPQVGELMLVPEAVQQVLLNLMLNALDALAQTPKPRLIIRTRRVDGGAALEVEDNGHGIAPEALSHIFEPFYTTKPVGQGTGLGLSISYSLVQRLGGRLEVESAPQCGSRFTIELPAAPPASRGRDNGEGSDS